MPSVARFRRILDASRSPLAFRYRTGDAPQAGETRTRASTALYRDSAGLWQSAAIDTLRDAHFQYDTATGLWKRTTLREGAGTNSALGACSFADGTYWATNVDITITTATSCISGNTAYKHLVTNGSPSRTQTVGTFVNGQSDCWSMFLENVDAAVTEFVVRDTTAAASLYYFRLTWASKTVATVSGTGSCGIVDYGTGPNGGALVRIYGVTAGVAAGTGGNGNTRRLDYYPASAVNKSIILHHAQFEAATSYPSSPIVTVASAVTRAADVWSFSWPYAPAAMTGLIDCYDFTGDATGLTPFALMITNSTGAAPYDLIFKITSKWRGRLGATAGASDSTAAAAVAFGSRAELRQILTVSGANVTSTLGQSINSAAEAVAAAGTARTLDAAYAAPTRMYIGAHPDGTAPANLAIRSILYVPQANYPLSALAGT